MSSLHDAMTADAASPTMLPGIRTFHSAAFRTTLAIVLLVIGVTITGLLLLRQASAEDSQFGIDFGDYYLAAQRHSVGESIYPPVLLGAPVDAQGVDRYRYPPLLAQSVAPFTSLSQDTLEVAWLLLQAAAVLAALWVGTGIGGARRSLERALWCGVAGTYFLPAFDTLWKGNVSGILALTSVAVAVGGIAGGVGAAIGTLLKSVPLTLLPAAIVADRRARWSAVVTLGVGVTVSLALAPQAWLDYPMVVANMLQGSTDYASNLSPGATVRNLGWHDDLADLVRLVSLVGAIGSVLLSIPLARSRDGLPAAALLGVIAMLLLPGSLWYHYLVVLLPFAAIAWVPSSLRVRVLLLVAAAAITIGVAWLPLALAGAIALAATALAILWPGAGGRASVPLHERTAFPRVPWS
jgi:hypothetical protein